MLFVSTGSILLYLFLSESALKPIWTLSVWQGWQLGFFRILLDLQLEAVFLFSLFWTYIISTPGLPPYFFCLTLWKESFIAATFAFQQQSHLTTLF